MRRLLILPLLAALAAGPSVAEKPSAEAVQQRNDAKLAKLLHGLEPAGTEQCIKLRFTNNTTQRVGDTILYRVSPKLVYRTDTGGGCDGLERGDPIVLRTFNGQLCRGDIAQTVSPVGGLPSGTCTIGTFTTYRAPAK